MPFFQKIPQILGKNVRLPKVALTKAHLGHLVESE